MIQRTIPISYEHRVAFTHGAFDGKNHTLRDLFADASELDGCAKVLVFLDSGVAASTPGLPDRIERYFTTHGETAILVSSPLVLEGGEACKNQWPLVERIWQAIEYHGVCRHSFVVAIGGGAFLDLVGFGAATAHRGVRLVRMPTTTLSQGDGGVGVKNGVNYFGKKNWVGTFAVPFAVVNDLDFLATLPPRACRDGIIEAVKVALIRDADFYRFLEANAEALARLERGPLERAIRRSAENHLEHISGGGDPFEYGSARPLDFGHWVAHKLEQLSDFSVTHGEAVAIGMAVDLLYSARIGMMKRATADRALELIATLGFGLWSEHLDRMEAGRHVVLAGLEEFREHLGGRLTITLVPEIGRKVEVNEMDETEVLAALAELKDLAAKKTPSSAEQTAALA